MFCCGERKTYVQGGQAAAAVSRSRTRANVADGGQALFGWSEVVVRGWTWWWCGQWASQCSAQRTFLNPKPLPSPPTQRNVPGAMDRPAAQEYGTVEANKDAHEQEDRVVYAAVAASPIEGMLPAPSAGTVLRRHCCGVNGARACRGKWRRRPVGDGRGGKGGGGECGWAGGGVEGKESSGQSKRGRPISGDRWIRRA